MSLQERNVVSFGLPQQVGDPRGSPHPAGEPPRGVVRADRPIGANPMEDGKLTSAEIERVLQVAKARGIRFGEAAVRLGLVTESEVRYALSKL